MMHIYIHNLTSKLGKHPEKHREELSDTFAKSHFGYKVHNLDFIDDSKR